MAGRGINVLLTLKDHFSDPMKKVIGTTQQSQRAFVSAQNTMGKWANNAGKAILKVGAVGATALGGLIAYSVKVGSEFEASMSKVAAISGATGDDFTQLREKAKEMGAKTKFSATEAGEALQYMAMAGWKTNDMLNGIEGVMNLAAASGEELASVSDIVTDALTAFKLTAKDSGHFADVLAAASSNANTNVGMLGESFKGCAALAGTMGYSVEDITMALGLMANSSIKGEAAGTALKNAIANMVSPTKEMSGVMEKLGVSLTDSQGKIKPFRSVMDDLRGSFSKMSEAEQASAASTLFGKRAMAGMLSIINASEADYNKLAGAIDNCDGTSAKMAKTMGTNLKGAFTIFKSAAESVGINIYDKINKPMTDSMNKINEAMQKVSQSINKGELGVAFAHLGEVAGNALTRLTDGFIAALPTIMKFVEFILNNIEPICAGFAAIAGAMIAAKSINVFTNLYNDIQRMKPMFTFLKEGFKGLPMLISKVGSAFSALGTFLLANPIVAVAAAIVALGAALYYAYNHCETFRNAVDSALSPVLETLRQKWDELQPSIQALWASLQALWDNVLSPIASFIGGVFSAAWQAAFAAISTYVQIYIDIISGALDGIFQALQGVIDFLTGVFTGNWSAAWSGIQNIFLGIWNAITGAFGGFISNVGSRLEGLVERIRNIKIPSIGGGGESHNATGTSYWKGGLTRVNENQRGELMNLPNGTQIIPHDLSVKALGGSGRSVNINLTVQGNVIGNEDFMNQCGSFIADRVKIALANC